MQLDCTDEDSIAKAASQVLGSHRHLDLLLNVAGILHIPGKMSPGTALRLLPVLISARGFSVYAHQLRETPNVLLFARSVARSGTATTSWCNAQRLPYPASLQTAS